jgi:hypothetical protein
VRLTAFAVLTLGEKPVAWGEGFPPPHFLLGFSDGSVEVKCVGALDSNQVRLTPAETACDGLGGGGLWGGAGGAGGGGGGGGGGLLSADAMARAVAAAAAKAVAAAAAKAATNKEAAAKE